LEVEGPERSLRYQFPVYRSVSSVNQKSADSGEVFRVTALSSQESTALASAPLDRFPRIERWQSGRHLQA
jgi:hypothetical protein